ncbi:hypothetical protein KC19_4G023500 [Ceratodon purpureus]|uniref:Uncharacterized protein n=1 Tax=Ceratodon purpureus TaxID=3225 RepID=A0A8T0I624_CERPU|nr:hypothetical protein KC19_4G023500 [Ceratodon purpureus]
MHRMLNAHRGEFLAPGSPSALETRPDTRLAPCPGTGPDPGLHKHGSTTHLADPNPPQWPALGSRDAPPQTPHHPPKAPLVTPGSQPSPRSVHTACAHTQREIEGELMRLPSMQLDGLKGGGVC